MKKIQKRKEKMRRWNTKRQEISAKSCKTVSPLRHQSNHWVRRSPSQEHPRRYYTLRGSQPIRQTERLGIQKCLVHVKRETETKLSNLCPGSQQTHHLTHAHVETLTSGSNAYSPHANNQTALLKEMECSSAKKLCVLAFRHPG